MRMHGGDSAARPQTSPAPSAPLDLVAASDLTPTLTDEDGLLIETLDEFDRVLAVERPRAEAVAALLQRLPMPTVRAHRITPTRTALKASEVRAYDQYFEVRRVESAATPLSLLRSLLVACRVFLTLWESGGGFDSGHLTLQREGFREYGRVLRRSLEVRAST